MSASDVAAGSTSVSARPVRVVVIDGCALLHDGPRGTAGDLDVVAEADNADAAVKAVVAHEPEVVLVDLRTRTEDGVAAIRHLAAREAAPPIVVLGDDLEPDHVREALRAGARGYLAAPVSADRLAAAVRRAAVGRWALSDDVVGVLVDVFVERLPLGVPPVTPREQEVLRLLAEGLPNRVIADRLGISTRTAQKHVENLFKKFNVHGRADLVSVAGRTGITN